MAIKQEADFIPQLDEFSTENIESTFESTLEERPGVSDSIIKSGWKAAEETIKPREYTKDFVVSETPQLVKFLDEGGPFAVYNAHWLDEKKEGQKSFVCLEEGCPLCLKLSNKPSKRYSFSVVIIGDDGTTILTKLNATPLLFRSLHAAEHSPAGPLTKNYWSLSRRGTLQSLVFTVTPVKGRDLMEDYGIDEAKVEEQVATMKAFEPSSVYRLNFDELTEIATALL
jgi:hypothetical protein